MTPDVSPGVPAAGPAAQPADASLFDPVRSSGRLRPGGAAGAVEMHQPGALTPAGILPPAAARAPSRG